MGGGSLVGGGWKRGGRWELMRRGSDTRRWVGVSVAEASVARCLCVNADESGLGSRRPVIKSGVCDAVVNINSNNNFSCVELHCLLNVFVS